MAVHVGQLTTEVTAVDGDLPLTPAQVEGLVQLMLRRIEQHARDRDRANEATSVRAQATPPRAGW